LLLLLLLRGLRFARPLLLGLARLLLLLRGLTRLQLLRSLRFARLLLLSLPT
jgi:hypothetical protein